MTEYINGTIYLDGELVKKDFLIREGKIFLEYPKQKYQTKDISGLIVSPGFVDVHVHTRVPGHEYKEDIKHVTEAALIGGVTTIVAMGNTRPRPENLENWKQIQEMQNESLINIIQVANVTKDDELINIDKLATHINIFSDDGLPIKSSKVMKDALVKMKEYDALIVLHEQDPEIKGVMYEGKYALENELPCFGPEYETNFTERDAELNRGINARMHFQHISAKGTLEVLKKCKREGILATAELTPHHLWFNTDDIDGDTNLKMNPPIASPEHQRELIKAYIEGDIDIIATDHAPHSEQDKSGGFRNASFGIIGLETCFAAIHTQFKDWVSIKRIIESYSINPGKLIRKDVSIKNGQKANITFIDINKKWVFTKNDIKSKSQNTPWIGTEFTGKIVKTIYGEVERGEI